MYLALSLNVCLPLKVTDVTSCPKHLSAEWNHGLPPASPPSRMYPERMSTQHGQEKLHRLLVALFYPKLKCTRILDSLRETLWRQRLYQENVLHGGRAHKPFSRGNHTSTQIWKLFGSIYAGLAQRQHRTGLTTSHHNHLSQA